MGAVVRPGYREEFRAQMHLERVGRQSCRGRYLRWRAFETQDHHI
jgi:hypothetical protein